MSALAALYEQDFDLWRMKNIECLRLGQWNKLDHKHLIEELDAIGKSEQREFVSRVAVLLAHLLKWTWQPECRSHSWSDTIIEQRFQLAQLFAQSPSLSRHFEASVERAYQLALTIASKETDMPKTYFPKSCPFSCSQILDENFGGVLS